METVFKWLLLSQVSWFYLALLALLVASAIARVEYASGAPSASTARRLLTFIRRNYWAASAINDDTPKGFAVGRWFASWTSENSRGLIVVWIVTPRWVQIVSEERGKRIGTKVVCWQRTGGPRTGMGYTKAEFLRPGDPSVEQRKAIRNILNMAMVSERNGYGFNLSVYIHGPPGSGKSQVGMFLARELGGAVCTEHTPLDAGDQLRVLLARANPQRKAPLVVIYNEWDVAVRTAFQEPGKYRTKDGIPEVWDKGSYSEYMDRLCQFDNVVFIFTGNTPPDEIARIDPSILRDGRVNIIIELSGVSEVSHLRGLRFTQNDHKKKS